MAKSATPGPRAVTPQQAVSHAIAASFERASVAGEKQLMETALRFGYGDVSPEDIGRELQDARYGILFGTVDGRTLVTTRAVLAEEQAMLAFARDGIGTCQPFAPRPVSVDPRFNQGQREAVAHVLGSRDRVMVIRGGQGTGKTTLILEAQKHLRQAGHEVFTFAPTIAARDQLRKEGLAHSETVARLLVDEVLQQRIKGQVLWVDEGGLVGVRDMGRVFQLAQRLGARVVITGDTRQHASVARGDAMRLLETHGGIRPAEVTEILRQKGDYKQAMDLLRSDTVRGFEEIDRQGWIIEAPDDVRDKLMAEDYAWHTNAGQSVLVVAPTHREGERVTHEIRQELKREGRLGQAEHSFFTLRNRRWAEADKRDAAMYRPGMVVQFMRHAPAIKAGQRFEITRVEQGRVFLRDGEKERALPLQLAQRFQVYTPGVLRLAEGDTLRVTQEGRTAQGGKVNAKTIYTVAGFDEAGNIRLSGGQTLDQGFMHLDYGYYTTSHSAQGQGVDRVIIAESADSFPAASQEQFYVSASRGKQAMRVYTGNREDLKQAVLRSASRGAATELVNRELEASAQPREIAERVRQQRARLRHIRAYRTQKAAVEQSQTARSAYAGMER
jgi:ATP-dependent exoDNAse (exonuclease V) alpha subunit